METLLRIEMLGRFSVFQGNREISRFRTQKTASLLAYLALYSARSHSREELIAQFWPDSPQDAARANLSIAVYALRLHLEPPGIAKGHVLLADNAQVRLNPLAFTCDVGDFESLLQQAHVAADPQQRVDFLKSALDLYRGDLLPGDYEEWALSERDRLQEAYRQALGQVIKVYVEGSQLEPALGYAHRLVQSDPLREESYRQLMHLYRALGRPEEALAQYQALERLLQKELQATPSSATRSLAEQLQLMAPQPRKAREARAADTSSQDVMAAYSPQLPGARPPAFKVPLQFTRFYGREETIAQMVEAMSISTCASEERKETLAASSSRLLTLTGPGGTGKTRLSIEVADCLKEVFPGGIWFVALAEVKEPVLIGEAIRDALDLPRQPQPAPLEQVIAFLRSLEQPCLLILDNFEQITAGGASVVWTLLQQVTLLACLMTSRQPLSLPGEREIPLLSLPAPIPEAPTPTSSLLTTHLLTYPSVALFVDRAQTALPVFQITPRNAQAIADICARLEGLPLAIELAAARARSLTPAQILEKLSERFALLASRKTDKAERHRSLWAAIDWSYHLLSSDLQCFFTRLSVFQGGWNLEASEEICAEPLALDYLGQLRAHSLILTQESTEEIRFRMLETIREFAAEQLKDAERAEAERRHAAYYNRWVSGAPWSGSEQPIWFTRFEEDLDNLRAALAWSLKEGNDIEIGLQTAGQLSLFWLAHGHLSEGRRWYARLLERAEKTPTEGLELSLFGAGVLAHYQGDFQAAIPLLERSLVVAHILGDEAILRRVHNELGSVAYRQGDFPQARFHYEKSLAVARARGACDLIASTLGNLANVAQATGDFVTSRTLNVESLGLWREAGDRHGESRTLHNLANLAHSQGQLAEARAYYEQSLAIKRELEDSYGISFSLTNLALVEKDQGDYIAAAAHARESLALARELHARMNLVYILNLLTDLTRAIGELEISARMYGTLDWVRQEMSYPLNPVEQDGYEESQMTLREALGTAVYDALKSEGRKLSLEQALACVGETLANRGL